ncbi:MAG: hypothetical protein WKF73_07645 [Nocardioidaceae bacterium]
MDDLIRGTRSDYQRAARERLFGPPDTGTADDIVTADDTGTADDGDDAA